MRNAAFSAFVVVAVGPLIGIAWGRLWAKANRLALRTKPRPSAAVEQDSQTA